MLITSPKTIRISASHFLSTCLIAVVVKALGGKDLKRGNKMYNGTKAQTASLPVKVVSFLSQDDGFPSITYSVLSQEEGKGRDEMARMMKT